MNDGGFRPGTTKRRPITLFDIASLVGVSTATVSLALRDNASVSPQTRARVKDAAAQLGYIYNRTAASMRSARSGMIGLLANNLTNSFMSAYVEKVEDTISEFSSALLVGSIREKLPLQRALLERFLQFKVDGVLLSPAADSTLADIAWFADTGVALVQAIREVEGAPFDYVGCDNEAGTRLALEHLHDLGHRRIACIGGRIRASTGIARKRGYCGFMQERDLAVPPAYWQVSEMTFEGGVAAGHALLALPEPPTAVVCFNDSLALGLAAAVRARSGEIGRSLSVIAFDDTAEAALSHPALTAVASGQGEIGKVAIRMLFERIDNPLMALRRHIVTPRLIIRASTAPLWTR